MKKSFKIAMLIVAGAVLATSCGPKSDLDGFKKTKSGLHYRFEVQNKDAQAVQSGDVLVGEMTMRLDEDTLYTNMGNPQRILQVNDGLFEGDVSEGLLMMHEGDKAIFAVEADSVAKFFQPNQMPPSYEQGKGMKFYYEINLTDIITKDEMAQEQANYVAEMEKRQQEEPAAIAKYVADNNITATPNADGLYVIVRKAGNGPKVAAGKQVKINYTGRLLDGTIFDSSVEKDAREGGVYNPQRPYEPLEYTVGQMSLIKGWDDGVMGLAQGTQVTLLMPSALAYGAQGAGQTILPYSPLTFDIEIVSVK